MSEGSHSGGQFGLCRRDRTAAAAAPTIRPPAQRGACRSGRFRWCRFFRSLPRRRGRRCGHGHVRLVPVPARGRGGDHCGFGDGGEGRRGGGRDPCAEGRGSNSDRT